jgi:hypothetical protein
MNTVEFIFRLIEILIAGAAVAIAWLGLQTWKLQLHGQYEFDLARKLAVAVLRYRDEILYTRGTISAENQASFRREFAAIKSELESQLLEAEIVWGHGVAEIRQKLLESGINYWMKIAEFNSLKKEIEQPIPEHLESKYFELMQIVEGPPEDEFGQNLQKAAEKAFELIRPHLPRPDKGRP